jgi:hypothetical protein
MMTNEQTQVERQAVFARYDVSQKFKVPKGINLKDSDQVEEYWIRYDCLYIELNKGHMEEWVATYYKKGDKLVNIEDGIIGARQKYIADIDVKEPCEMTIDIAEDYNILDSDDEEVEEEEEEEVEN